jgi:hypothetical protein
MPVKTFDDGACRGYRSTLVQFVWESGFFPHGGFCGAAGAPRNHDPSRVSREDPSEARLVAPRMQVDRRSLLPTGVAPVRDLASAKRQLAKTTGQRPSAH